jgi:2-furoate---CoA ligase
MDLGTVMRWTAERFPERPAVRGPGRHLSYREWDARTNRLARAMAAAGVRPGDRVAFALTGGEPLASLHLAAQKLGAVSVPLSTRFGPEELRYCVSDAAATLLIADPANAQPLPQATSLGGTSPRSTPTPSASPTTPSTRIPPRPTSA